MPPEPCRRRARCQCSPMALLDRVNPHQLYHQRGALSMRPLASGDQESRATPCANERSPGTVRGVQDWRGRWTAYFTDQRAEDADMADSMAIVDKMYECFGRGDMASLKTDVFAED